MNLEISKEGDTLIAYMGGELDHHSANEFREKIDQELGKNIFQNILLDMSELTFMDSSGLGAILGRYKKISETGGKVKVCNLTPQVAKLFHCSDLHKIIKVYPSIEEATKEL